MPIVVVSLIAALVQVFQLPRIEQVSWLRGCWEMQTRDGTLEAQWLSPRASSMLGVSRTIRGATLAEYEMTLIRERGDRLSYETHPSHDEPDLFLSIAIDNHKIVFENLKPRFPARVGYELAAPDRLLAWTEGSRDGQTRRTESAYDRVSCPGE
jgi:hypothetical protein